MATEKTTGFDNLRICMMSHLSDIQEEVGFDFPGQEEQIIKRANFVKFLLLKYLPDTKVNINKEWEMFNGKK